MASAKLNESHPISNSRVTVSTAAWVVALATLAGVFALYTRPTMMVTLADFVWACFGSSPP